MSSDLDLSVVIKADAGDLAPAMDESADKVESTTSKITEAFASMSENVQVSMEHVTEKITEGVKESNEQLESMAKGIKSVNEYFALMAEVATLGEIGKQLEELAVFSAEYAEKINLAAQRTGFTGDELQRLGFAASTANVGFDEMTSGMEKLNRSQVNAREGNKQLQAAFAAVGVSMEQLKNDSPEEILETIANSFQGTIDNADKTALAMQLLGRAGANMIPVLDKGKEGLEELGNAAASVGSIMDAEAREKAQEFAEQLKLATAASTGLKLTLSAELAPAMQMVTENFVEQSKEGGLYHQMAEGVGQIVTFLTKAFETLAFIVGVVGKSLGALAAAYMAFENANFKEVGAVFKNLGADIADDYNKLDKLFNKMENPPEKEIDFGDEEEKKGSLHAPGAGKEKQESQMQAFEAELAQEKANNDRMQDETKQFHQYSLEAEQEFWKSKIAVTEAGSQDRQAVMNKYYSLSVQVDKEKFQASIETMKAEEVAAGKNGDAKIQIAMKVRDTIIAAYGEESKEGQAAVKEYQTVFQQVHQEKVKAAQDASKAQMTADLAVITNEEALYKISTSKMAVSQEQMLADTQAFADRKFEIQKAALDKEKALIDPNTDPNAYAAKLQQILALTQAHDAAMQQTALKTSQLYALDWNKAFSSVDSALVKTMNDIITHTTTVAGAMKSLMLSIGQAILQMLEKTAAEWAIDQAKKLAGFTAQGTAATTSAGVQSAAAETTALANATAAATAAESWAGVAGAAGVASFAGAPWPVDIGAPAFGAGMYAAASAFAIPAAEKGFDIPQGVNPVTQLHEKEMVLPQKQADAVRNMAENGGGGGNQPVQLHVHATDAQSVRRLFENNGSVLADVLQQQMRRFRK